jgi:pimeloyl-ACP methyl ester carboxylesterase
VTLPKPTLVLLHGLGATRGVWAPMLAQADDRWPGEVLAPNLRGHGRSPRANSYALRSFAADVGGMLAQQNLADGYIVLGHSMGGVVGLALASGLFGPPPKRALGLGVKVAWTDEEAAGLKALAEKPAKLFATRDEAVERYLKASGLIGLVDPGSEMALEGVVEDHGGWRLACDPRTAEVGPPPMKMLVTGAQCPFALACGETDRMVSVEQLRAWDPEAEALAGLGHNAMVEDPSAVWDWVHRKL